MLILGDIEVLAGFQTLQVLPIYIHFYFCSFYPFNFYMKWKTYIFCPIWWVFFKIIPYDKCNKFILVLGIKGFKMTTGHWSSHESLSLTLLSPAKYCVYTFPCQCAVAVSCWACKAPQLLMIQLQDNSMWICWQLYSLFYCIHHYIIQWSSYIIWSCTKVFICSPFSCRNSAKVSCCALKHLSFVFCSLIQFLPF